MKHNSILRLLRCKSPSREFEEAGRRIIDNIVKGIEMDATIDNNLVFDSSFMVHRDELKSILNQMVKYDFQRLTMTNKGTVRKLPVLHSVISIKDTITFEVAYEYATDVLAVYIRSSENGRKLIATYFKFSEMEIGLEEVSNKALVEWLQE